MRVGVGLVVVTVALAAVGAAGGHSAAQRCFKTTAFEVSAVPGGATGEGSDVYVRGIPRKAKNIRLSFRLARSGAVPPRQLFPHQNWIGKGVGFASDGSYRVQVFVSGAGFGMPATTRKRFQVTVSYDCLS